jgi:hypothetical protein
VKQFMKEKKLALATKGPRFGFDPTGKNPFEVLLSGESDLLGKEGDKKAPLPAEAVAKARKETEGDAGVLPAEPSSSLGADKDEKAFRKYIVDAIKSKKMSRGDFNKAIDAHLGSKASKEAKIFAADKTLAFLSAKGVKIS